MIRRFPCGFSLLLTVLALFSAHQAGAQTTSNPARLEVDLREAPRHIFHAKLALPVNAGSLTLVYPKWIPGEHAPTGPIVDLVGLKIAADGREVSWRRDDVDMFAFHVDVPAGVETLNLSYDYLSPAEASGSRSSPPRPPSLPY